MTPHRDIGWTDARPRDSGMYNRLVLDACPVCVCTLSGSSSPHWPQSRRGIGEDEAHVEPHQSSS